MQVVGKRLSAGSFVNDNDRCTALPNQSDMSLQQQQQQHKSSSQQQSACAKSDAVVAATSSSNTHKASAAASSSNATHGRQQQQFSIPISTSPAATGAPQPATGQCQQGVSVFNSNSNKPTPSYSASSLATISHVDSSSSTNNSNSQRSIQQQHQQQQQSKSSSNLSAPSQQQPDLAPAIAARNSNSPSQRRAGRFSAVLAEFVKSRPKDDTWSITFEEIKPFTKNKQYVGRLFRYARIKRAEVRRNEIKQQQQSQSLSSIVNNNHESNNNITHRQEQQQQQQQQHPSSISSAGGSSSHPQLSSTSENPRHGSPSHRQELGSHVGNNNMEGQVVNSSSTAGVAANSSKPSGSSNGRASDSVHHQEESSHGAVNETSLHVNASQSSGSSGNGLHASSQQVSESAECTLCKLSNQARNAVYTRATGVPDFEVNGKLCVTCAVDLSGLQNGFSLGRHRESHQGKDHLQSSSKPSAARKRSGDSVGCGSQDQSVQTVQGDWLHGGARSEPSSNDDNVESALEVHENGCEVVPQVNSANVQVVEEVPGNSQPQLPLLQGNSVESHGRTRRGGQAGSSSDSSGGQASRPSTESLPRLYDSLHHQEGGSRQDARNSKRHNAALADSFRQYVQHEQSFAPSRHIINNTNNNILSSPITNNNNNNQSQHHQRHSMLRQNHTTSSKLPTTEQLHSVHLHSTPVGTLNLSRVKSIMSDSQKQKLENIEHTAFRKTLDTLDAQAAADPHYFNKIKQQRSDFLPKFAEKLVEDKLCTPLPRDKLQTVRGKNNAFVVLEEKPTGHRLRFILWTKDANEVLNDYEAKVDLKHSSFYIDAVSEEAAVVGDMKISFFQYEIPEKYRCMFAFCDSDGNWYTLNRLPMGFRPSVEIIQLICETLSLQSTAVVPSIKISSTNNNNDGDNNNNNNTLTETVQLTSNRTSHRTWVDGFQVTGRKEECEAVFHKIKKISNYVGVTWKDDGVELLHEYDFIGIHFNHNLHQVSVADKTLTKLPQKVSTTQPYFTTELEAMISRLYFCAGVLRLIPADYYFVIKQINRYVSRLNKTGATDEQHTLPGSVVSSLNEWIKQSRTKLTLPPDNQYNSIPNNKNKMKQKKKFDVLFIDASLWGWGAFFVGADGVIAIAGGAWTRKFDQDELTSDKIAELEGIALNNGLKTFEERLNVRKNVDIRIDNTSLMYGTRKGKSKTSPALNQQIKIAVHFLKERNFCFTVAYVHTAENWADHPSRNDNSKCPTRTQVQQILNSNRGFYGRQSKVDVEDTSVSVISHLSNTDSKIEDSYQECSLMT